jgi:hypothetical protein
MGAIENLLGRAYQFVIGHKLLVVRKKRKPAKEFFQIERRATNDELRDLLFSFQGSTLVTRGSAFVAGGNRSASAETRNEN